MLRACGCALFRDIMVRWQSEESGFFGNWGAAPSPDDEGAREIRVSLARKASENSQAVRRAWARIRCAGGSGGPEGTVVEDVIYVCGLAEAMGYQSVVRQLEGFCFRISQEMRDEEFWGRFLEKRAMPISDPHFLYSDIILDSKRFSAAQISIELISGVWLVSFLANLEFSDGWEIAAGAEELVRFFGGYV